MGRLLLIRHGQASWDSDDYDVLSERGWEQSRVLGRSLAAREVRPDVVVSGSMRRHRETAEACLSELGLDAEPLIDEGWNEFDHVAMLSKVTPEWEGREPTLEEFGAWFESATARWTGGEYDDYEEPFAVFTDRVDAALRRTTEAAGESGTVAVFTSGGPIAWSATSLLTREAHLWHRLNRVCANTGVSKFISGRAGLNLITLNEHTHLDTRGELITYR